MKMSITRALNEVKLLDAKIQKKINESSFVSCKMNKSAKLTDGVTTPEEFMQLAKSNMQSILDLTNRRKDIKTKIVQSNANTEVEIAGIKMTVADAIERKSSIEIDRSLLNRMKSEYRAVTGYIVQRNQQLEDKISKLVDSLVGSDKKDTNMVKTAEELAQNTRDNESYVILDPLKLLKSIETLEQEIMEFESNVDFVLSESNSITSIEIED